MEQCAPTRRRFLTSGAALPLAASAAPAAGVEYRTLGRTGLKVSSVGFGCMITSDASVLQKAADMGINYFDTARVYQDGNNERMVGSALKSRRKDLIISSKVATRSAPDASRDLGLTLSELRTDYLDIWFLHSVSSAADFPHNALNVAVGAKKAGKVRFIGVSTHAGQIGVIQQAVKSGAVDVVMTSYNFALEQKLTPVIENAAKAGLGVVAIKVMAGGFRAPGYYPSPGKLRQIFKRPGAMLAALKWVVGNPNVASALPSMVDMEQLEENFKAMSQPFGEEDVRTLSAYLEEIRPRYCRMCGTCDGTCGQGIQVADVLRSLTYAEGYGQFALGRSTYRGLPVSGNCADCRQCTVQCPHGVAVAQRVRHAQDLFA